MKLNFSILLSKCANLKLIIFGSPLQVRTRGESCGGEVTCVVRNVSKGLGSPVFDKLEAELAKAMMSLPATKVRRRQQQQQSRAEQSSLSSLALSCSEFSFIQS